MLYLLRFEMIFYLSKITWFCRWIAFIEPNCTVTVMVYTNIIQILTAHEGNGGTLLSPSEIQP